MKELIYNFPQQKLKCGDIVKYYEDHRITIGRIVTKHKESWLEEDIIRTNDMIILSYNHIKANPILVKGHAINGYNTTYIDTYLTDEEFSIKYPEYIV